jgi:acetyl-CoA C-acetyltransferase
VTRAQAAVADGRFRDEIAPVTVKGRGGDIEITDDETPARCNLDRLATLKPAFRKEGTVTAGNASSISDGAAALVLMRESEAARRGATVLARFSGLATHAQAPSRVHIRAGRRHPPRARQGGLDEGRRRPLRNQRSIRRGDVVCDART